MRRNPEHGNGYTYNFFDKFTPINGIDNTALRGVHPSIDAEVMRVVKSSPRWEKPAMKESVPITVSYVIPMVFTLNGYNRDSSKISKELKDLKDQKVLDEITVVSYP
jgi:hypothetical protein